MVRSAEQRRQGRFLFGAVVLTGLLAEAGPSRAMPPEGEIPPIPVAEIQPECPPGPYPGPERNPCPRLPPGAIPPPNGSYVRAWQNLQIAKAELDDFVIYRNEWYKGGLVLGPYGRYHINQIVQRLPGVPFPVVIQPELDEHVNEARRQTVIQLLAHAGIGDAPQRVVIGFPLAEGLYGEEAPRIYQRLILGGGLQAGVFGRGIPSGGLGVGRTAPFGGVGGGLGFPSR